MVLAVRVGRIKHGELRNPKCHIRASYGMRERRRRKAESRALRPLIQNSALAPAS